LEGCTIYLTEGTITVSLVCSETTLIYRVGLLGAFVFAATVASVRVGVQRVKERFHFRTNKKIRSFVVRFIKPFYCLICIADSHISYGELIFPP
jgi:hypothetical protein